MRLTSLWTFLLLGLLSAAFVRAQEEDALDEEDFDAADADVAPDEEEEATLEEEKPVERVRIEFPGWFVLLFPVSGTNSQKRVYYTQAGKGLLFKLRVGPHPSPVAHLCEEVGSTFPPASNRVQVRPLNPPAPVPWMRQVLSTWRVLCSKLCDLVLRLLPRRLCQQIQNLSFSRTTNLQCWEGVPTSRKHLTMQGPLDARKYIQRYRALKHVNEAKHQKSERFMFVCAALFDRAVRLCTSRHGSTEFCLLSCFFCLCFGEFLFLLQL